MDQMRLRHHHSHRGALEISPPKKKQNKKIERFPRGQTCFLPALACHEQQKCGIVEKTLRFRALSFGNALRTCEGASEERRRGLKVSPVSEQHHLTEERHQKRKRWWFVSNVKKVWC